MTAATNCAQIIFVTRTALILYCLAGGLLTAADSETGFALQDVPGKQLDVLLDGKIAARYQYEYDTSSKERISDTYKPYLHIFNRAGTEPITKGPGGDFPHHRAIFLGWCKVSFESKVYDLWHMKGTAIIHRRFITQEANADQARVVAQIDWVINQDQAIISEERAFTFHRSPSGRFTVDQTSRLTATKGEVHLDGDPEHAGMQYRPAAAILTAETSYVFPRTSVDVGKDRDYPWVGETYALADGRHSVVFMNHPTNPTGTRYSAYRNYGRFGAFPTATIPANGSLLLTYRFLIADGELPTAAAIQQAWDAFAGVTTPSPVPPLTVKAADQPKPKSKDAKPAPAGDPKPAPAP